MDSRLEAHLTTEIPRLASSVMRDARRQMARLWNEGKANAETYGPAFDLDDLKQEMWLEAVAREGILSGHLDAGNEDAISVVLKGAGRRVVTAEKREIRAKKAALAGYETYDEVFYTLGSLRRLLPMYLDNDKEIALKAPRGRELDVQVSNGGTVHHGDYMVTMIDLDRAFVALREPQRKILGRYFSYPQGSGGWTHNEISSAMGMKPNELSSRVHYALKALQRELGGQNPWNRGPTPGRGK
jgi:hypothetical protein